jgi:hypothetical protein
MDGLIFTPMPTNIQTRVQALAMSLALAAIAPDDRRANLSMRVAKRFASRLRSRKLLARANAKATKLIVSWQKDGSKINRWVKGQEPTLESIDKWEQLARCAKLLSARID